MYMYNWWYYWAWSFFISLVEITLTHFVHITAHHYSISIRERQKLFPASSGLILTIDCPWNFMFWIHLSFSVLLCSFILIQFGCPNLIRMCQMLCLLSITKFNKILLIVSSFFHYSCDNCHFYYLGVLISEKKKSVVSIINNTYQCADVISSCAFFYFKFYFEISTAMLAASTVYSSAFLKVSLLNKFLLPTHRHTSIHTQIHKINIVFGQFWTSHLNYMDFVFRFFYFRFLCK